MGLTGALLSATAGLLGAPATAAARTAQEGAAREEAPADDAGTTPPADRASPVAVTITGVSKELLRNVRSHLGILGLRGSEGALEHRVRRHHERAGAEIRAALEPFGHYRPSVESELERLGPDRWRAAYRIRPGPTVTIGQVDLRVTGEGRADPALARVVRRSGVEAGAPLRHPAYEGLKSRLSAVATARGYLDAGFREARVEVDLERYRAAVRLHFDTGPRYRFGAVRFVETPRFSDSFYRSLVPIEPGAPYSLARLLEFQALLAGSGYFRRAEVEAPRDSARDLTVPVLARVEVRPRSALSLGVGFSTDRGPRVGGEWSLRYLGAGGDRLASEAWAGLYRQTAAVRYVRPVGIPGQEELSAAAGFRREEFQEVTARSLHGTVGVTHRRGGWRETVQLRVEREWFAVGGVETAATLVLPRVTWSRAARDEALQPSRGGRLTLELQGTSTALGSDVAFLQASVDGKLVRSPYPGGRILARVAVGLTAVDDLRPLPPTLRFFAGGDESVRGYAYNSLGPRNAAGEVVGGRHRFVGSVEFDQRVFGPFSAAAFVDAGTAVVELSAVDRPSVGTGVGVRWRSPIGPVRLDLAFPLDDPDTSARLHFLVGPDL